MGPRRYMLNGGPVVIVLAVLACVSIRQAAVLAERVDTRVKTAVNPSYQSSAGRANVYQGQYRPINTQLYVTGQVTGLRSFRGNVGYRAPNELNTRVPSAGLSTFLRQSVGLQDVISSQTYLAQPYFNRSQTAWQAGGVLAGRSTVGSNFLRTPQGAAASAAGRAVGAPKPLYYDPSGIYSEAFPRVTAAGVPEAPSAPPMVAPQAIAQLSRALAAVPSGQYLVPQAYGLAQPGQRAKLAEELAELVPRQGEVQGRLETEVQAAVEGLLSAEPTLTPRERAEQAEPESPPGESAGLPIAGEDAFVELLMKIQEREQQVELESQDPPVQTEDEGEQSVLRRRLLRPKSVVQGADEQDMLAHPERLARKLVELKRGQDLVIHSFAGGHMDWFNINLAAAAEHLAAGRYYQASRRYEFAVSLNPANPMARLGHCLSLFAAGEPLAAGLNLRQAMAVFEPIMETRLDVSAMMDAEVFAHRLGLLRRRIKDRGSRVQPLMYLTATFMYRSIGQDAQARQHAQKLSEVAGDDELLHSYARYVLTGRRGRRQAQTRPAGG